jgi:predicted house-cleaning NTP pyrophosphatase (Maf/HAM1 superfamily)
MAEKNETEKKVKEDKKEKYQLSDAVLNSGYNSKIEGREFIVDFETNFKGERTSRFASCGNYQRVAGAVEFKSNGQNYFEDLTDEQVRQLALAGAIVLTPEQQKDFRKKFYS